MKTQSFFKTFLLAIGLIMTSGMWGAIDWSAYSWVGNGSGNAAYTDAFKVDVPAGCGLVNIQSSFGTEPGFYVTVPAADITCSLAQGKYAIQGAGMLLYVSAFTAKETEVTVTCNGGNNYVFTVYYKNGSDGEQGGGEQGGGDPEPAVTAPTEAAPVPAHEAAKVVSIYSDTYDFAPESLLSYNEGWWNAPSQDEIEIGGNHMLHYYGAMGGMIGWQFGTINISSMTNLHVDIWAQTSGTITMGPTSVGPTVASKALTVVGGQWNRFDLSLAEDFPDLDKTIVFQNQFTGYSAQENFYVDNFYFYTTREPGEEPEPEPEPEYGPFLGDGAGGGAYSNKYKVLQVTNLNPVNIQQPGFATEPSIYVEVAPALGAITGCSLPAGTYNIQGGGIALHLSAFTFVETEVTLTAVNGNVAFKVYYADGMGFSAYCNYYGNETKSLQAGGRYAALLWETDPANGNIVVTIADGPNATNTTYRGNGLGNLDGFKVYSGVDFSVEEAASVYFSSKEISVDKKVYTLVKKGDVDLPVPAQIRKVDGAFEWKCTEDGDAYNWGRFTYEYNTNCLPFAAPTNVAVTDAGVVTFDAVEDAVKYTALVYHNDVLQYSQVVESGDALEYASLVGGTHQVKVVAQGYGRKDSEESVAANWEMEAQKVTSEYCDQAMSSGNKIANFTWITLDNGDVQIIISEADGGAVGTTSFRGNGMCDAALGRFKVGEQREAASTYFERVYGGAHSTTYTLHLKDGAELAMGTKIYFENQTVEWYTSRDNNAYANLTFVYTYGATCPVEVSAMSLDKTAATMSIGDELTLHANVLPSIADQSATWVSSNPEVAEVDRNGVVTALALGTTTITATSKEDDSFSASCVITVSAAPVFYVANYVHKRITNANGDMIYLTCLQNTKGNYQLRIEGENLNGLGGSFYNPGAVDLRTAIVSSSSTEIVCEISAASDPNIYTPLYVLMPGEVQFAWPNDIVWGTVPTASAVYDTNFALTANGGSATASSGTARNAIDGDFSTRWESASTDPQWWVVDFGQERIFNTVAITWETAYGKTFNLQLSNDNEHWYTYKAVDRTLQNANHSREEIEFDHDVAARYVRFYGTARGTGYGYSFYEFEVNLPNVIKTLTTFTLASSIDAVKNGGNLALNLTAKDQNGSDMDDLEVAYTIVPAAAGEVRDGKFYPAQKGLATIYATANEMNTNELVVYVYDGTDFARSTAQNNKIIDQSESYNDAFAAVDGNDGSTWQGAPTDGTENNDAAKTYDAWFVVNLGALVDVECIAVHFEGASSAAYHVDFSLDNETWNAGYNSVPADNRGQTNHWKYMYAFETNQARYVRFWSTKAATQYGMKMFTFEVYGTAIPATYPLTTEDTDFYTFYANEELSIPEGMKAFTGVFNDGALVLNELTEVIPAQTGVLVKTENAGNYNFVESYTGAPAVAENSLRGVAETTARATVIANEKTRLGLEAGDELEIFVVGKKNDVVGFYKSTKDNVSAHRAYVPVTADMKPAANAPIRIVMQEDVVTGMEDIETSENVVKFIENGTIYILRGAHVYDVMGRLVK